MTQPDLPEIIQQATTAIQNAQTLLELEQQRVLWLGKKSQINGLMAALGGLEPVVRRERGADLNAAKQQLDRIIRERHGALEVGADAGLSPVDLSVPYPLTSTAGQMHPTLQVLEEIYSIFTRLGFALVEGPEIETDWYNFEVLNMPPDHPAREMQDTFYIKAAAGEAPLVPRTHTSASQIRYMEQHQPPFKIIVPGKVYRNEDEDRTHLWSFYQVEGLVVGENISVADLKGTLLHVMRSLFGEDAKIRLRPSYFPYTEPSFEIDVWYQNDWLEICGAGMVHADVLRRGGVDPEQYSGFAFGFGPDRLTVIRYGLKDIRLLWRPNLLISTKESV